MAKFRYKGVVVDGEVEEENGMMVPNIKRSIEAYGYKFNSKTYTEVPDDASFNARILDRIQEKLVPAKVSIVEKLRNNREFEEQAA